MNITALKQQIRNPERVNIFIDGKYGFSLTISQVLGEKLTVKLELDESRISELKSKSLDEKLRMRAMNWALLRPRSVLELRQYLKRVTYSKKPEEKANAAGNIQAIVDEFLGRAWLDDAAFAKWWVGRSSRKNKSTSFLNSELMSKGIDRQTILSVIGVGQDRENLKVLYSKIKDKAKYQDHAKLQRFLISRGYSYSLVKEVVDAAGIDTGD